MPIAQSEDVARTDDIETETETTTERPKSARELALESIEAARDREFEEESGVAIEREAEQQEPEAPAAETPAEAPVEEPVHIDKVLSSDEITGTKVKIKVDGEERVVPLEQVLRDVQKSEAAARRLEEATRLLNEARERAAQQPEQPQQPAAPSEPGADDKYIAALLDGDNDAARAAFRDAVGKAVEEAISGREDAILQSVTKTVVPQVKQQLTVESALSTFQRDFSDVVGNPHLAAIADTFLDAELAKGTDFAAALTQAGTATRDWMRSQAESLGYRPPEPKTEKEPTATRQEKLERKQSIDEVPTANAISTSTQEDEPESNSSVIAAMKKQRGQLM